MDKIAIIDMGTNTFHLLIAEKTAAGHRIIYRTHEAVKIGMHGINEGLITEPACARAHAAMARFGDIIRKEGATEVHAFATSAIRNASNGPTLANDICSLTGIPVRIISGNEEADLIFDGVKRALKLGTEKALVLDIGAGSVECIVGNGQGSQWKQSFEIGGQRLLEKFHKHDPITADEIAALDVFFEDNLPPLLEALRAFNPVVLAGSSGTFDTLSDIFCIRRQIPRTFEEAETPLTHAGFYEIYQELIRKDRSARLQIPGMAAMRVDMIVVACCLIRFILTKHTFHSIRVSTYSLKEGALARLTENI